MNQSIEGAHVPFFSVSRYEQRKALVDVALSWHGTPFRKGSAVKGAGVDCVRLADAVYREAGFETGFNPRKVKYSLDGGRHCKKSKVETWLETSGDFKHVLVKRPDVGDLILFRMGGVVHHVGVAIDATRFVHAVKHYGTIFSQLDDPTWKTRIEAVYRPMTIRFGITTK